MRESEQKVYPSRVSVCAVQHTTVHGLVAKKDAKKMGCVAVACGAGPLLARAQSEPERRDEPERDRPRMNLPKPLVRSPDDSLVGVR